MSVFANYLLYLLPSSYAGVCLLSFIQIFFLHKASDIYLSSLPVTFGGATLIVLALAIVVYVTVKPCDEIFADMKQKNRNVNLKEKITILKTCRKLNKITVISVILSFVIGNMACCLWQMKTEVLPFEWSRVIVVFLMALSYGFFDGMFMLNASNEMFTKYRKMLHINALAKEQKTMSVSTSIIWMGVSAVLFVILNLFAVGFGFVNENMSDELGSYVRISALLGLVLILVTSGLFMFVLNGLKKRISASTAIISDLESGSLSSRIDIVVFDDFGILNSEINKLIKKLTDMLNSLRMEAMKVNNSANMLSMIADNADQTLSSMNDSLYKIQNEGNRQSNEINGAGAFVTDLVSSLKDVEGHIVEGAESMKVSSESMTNMAVSIDSVAEKTRKADELSVQLSELIGIGSESLVKASQTVESIHAASNEVKDIVKVLQKIASQTNLLSMNASIEAAHAGDAGSGFAVVAGEVRELAFSSSESSQKIQDYIKDMVDKVEAGVQAIEATSSVFGQIQECIQQNSDLVDSISSSMVDQQSMANNSLMSAKSVYEDTKNVRNLILSQSEITQKVESSMNTAVSSTRSMIEAIETSSAQAKSMQEVIGQINQMIRDNKATVERMNDQMSGFSL